ncbi:GNAT family N-acetyltransferase [Ferrimonas aestuarii]|uniref:GNAT family N-acetyltransferase n=1 Tax=Ferrimonas aestuarii TaxID=2569539 RepID=A0A4U1BDG7_9GAMM|nr:GNAT family N-acetyltransferase [Ferrimonas aestuarii]TKB49167.1 GNAT family N-acetyltransferase [Ferrimonas aestuarii]
MKSNPVTIRPIQPSDDAEICRIIKQVGAEFGAIGDGFGPSDAEVLAMSAHYGQGANDNHNSCYLVATMNGLVVGGCGVAPFQGSLHTCELKKLFLLPQGRGRGIGKALTLACLAFAKEQNFRRCYLDTLKTMTTAIELYQQLGFTHLDAPLAASEHRGCDVWMIKTL